MEYLELLENSFKEEQKISDYEGNKYAYLCDYIFYITTYDDGVSELIAKKALEVCNAINDRKTFDYIIDKDNYLWFILMCNYDFFQTKINWGTSIRGAFWDIDKDKPVKIDFCGLFWEGEQLREPLTFNTKEEWEVFVKAINDFVRE